MQVCMYVCIDVCKYVQVCVQVRNVCMYRCVQVCKYASACMICIDV